mgnify:CR=1 FL=1
MDACPGNGECLIQSGNFYKKNLRYVCKSNCQPIKCPNYRLCKKVAPRWYYNRHEGLCENCNCTMTFGLSFTNTNVEEENGLQFPLEY